MREGRRLVGEITLTEHHITGKGEAITQHPDTIAIGEFPIDSFPCRKRQPGDTIVLEGYLGMLDHITRPYEIPYRVMIPKTIDGILATGRSDFPNQVNNVLGFPFIFRGALDVRARAINSEMQIAAVEGLRALARDEAPLLLDRSAAPARP